MNSIEIGYGTPALGDQTLLGNVEIEEIHRVIDRLDLSGLRQP
jgi:hypothetical protein